jgi:hypothetical protein
MVVHGLAPAWLRFGVAVAGLCHRAAMEIARYSASFYYSSLYSISTICSSSAY